MIRMTMVEYHDKYKPDLYEPHTMCDCCGKRIDNASLAGNVWFTDRQGQVIDEIDSLPGNCWDVHKQCLDTFKAVHMPSNAMFMWAELRTHQTYTCNNTRLA